MVELFFFSKHLNVVVWIFFYAKRKHFFVKQKRMPSDTCYKFSFVICFTWQNAKCYCVVNTHSSLLQQLQQLCHILYTTNTCRTEIELLTSQAFLLCVSFTLACGLMSLGTRQSNNLAGFWGRQPVGCVNH